MSSTIPVQENPANLPEMSANKSASDPVPAGADSVPPPAERETERKIEDIMRYWYEENEKPGFTEVVKRCLYYQEEEAYPTDEQSDEQSRVPGDKSGKE